MIRLDQFTDEEKGELEQSISDLEKKVRAMDDVTDDTCDELIRTTAKLYNRFVQYLGKKLLDGDVWIAQNVISCGTVTVEYYYNEFHSIESDQDELPITPQQENDINFMIEEYRSRMDELKARFTKEYERQRDEYDKLVELTIIDEPFRQVEMKDRMILYADCPDNTGLLRVEMDLSEMQCEYPWESNHMKQFKLRKYMNEKMRAEAEELDANVYILRHPSGLVSGALLLAHAIYNLKLEYDEAKERAYPGEVLDMLSNAAHDDWIQFVYRSGEQILQDMAVDDVLGDEFVVPGDIPEDDDALLN